MADELREKVARGIYAKRRGRFTDPVDDEMWATMVAAWEKRPDFMEHIQYAFDQADAALSLIRPAVLREAIAVADEERDRQALLKHKGWAEERDGKAARHLEAETAAVVIGEALRALAEAPTPPPPASAQREGGE